MANWLVKEEPEHYSYDALVREGRTVWAGVKNPLAQKHLRSIRKGDCIFYYHTGKEKAVVAIARAASDAKDTSGTLAVVDVVPEWKLARPCPADVDVIDSVEDVGADASCRVSREPLAGEGSRPASWKAMKL
jgi:hypothetical protein